MLVLAFDTVAAGCSVALLEAGQLLVLRQEPMARGQDARLIPLVQEVLSAAGKTMAMLERIVVLRGPGSFTGIRIGLAAARGLGLALGKPVLGFDRLWLHQKILPDCAERLVVLDSRRDELFCQLFIHAVPQPPFMAKAVELAVYDRVGLQVCGDAAQHCVWQQATYEALPEAEIVGAGRLAASLDPADYQALPLYLRAPDVSCGPKPAQEEAVW